MKSLPRILIAGVGNELRQDDAFGVQLVRYLMKKQPWPAHIKLMEVGIGGIHLVQELYDGYQVLILADAVNSGGQPGQVYLRELDTIRDLNEMPQKERHTFLADMHYTNPIRALMLAKALKVIPKQVLILGCEAKQHDDFAIGLSKEVERALPTAYEIIIQWMKNEGLTAPAST